MQSSGTGNCVNMLSRIKGGRFPFLTLVSMRGDFGEGNPWQFPMGQAVQPVLEAMGVICLRIGRPEEVVPSVSAALTMVFQSGQAVAVLLTQKLLGAKQFLTAFRRRTLTHQALRAWSPSPALRRAVRGTEFDCTAGVALNQDYARGHEPLSALQGGEGGARPAGLGG
jgi:hypothetical protein